jgi:cytochrome b subunit of formate dehydrogenase/pimeloyl-ACP methyl ester carboxylesterase
MTEGIMRDKNLVVRHSLIELLEHWSIAISGLLLILTGLFELPIARRYFITELPGLAWSGDFIISLKVHYAASIVFIAASLFHLIYHGFLGERAMIPRKGDLKESLDVIKTFFGKGEEPPFHKYLPEQRLAYLGMAAIIALLIISGLMKTYKNIYNPQMSETLTLWATWTHNIGFVLFFLAFLAHIAAIIIKPNRPMIRGIFTGRVRLDYAEKRHPLWFRELESGTASEVETMEEKKGEAIDYTPYSGPETSVDEYYISLSDGVSLRVIDFIPPSYTPGKPVIVFVAGLISLIAGWREVLKILTPLYRTLYIETREKVSARLPEERKVKEIDFSIDRMSKDLHELLEEKIPHEQPFYFVASSLGSTAVLDYLSQSLRQPRLAFIISPVCEFDIPSWGVPIIKYFPASLYTALKPPIKWYLRNIRLDKEKEPEQVKKYEGTMDAAEPKRLQAHALKLKDYSLWDKLPNVSAPVIIIGAGADKIHGPEIMGKVVASMPAARLEMMESNRETHSEKAGAFIIKEITEQEDRIESSHV